MSLDSIPFWTLTTFQRLKTWLKSGWWFQPSWKIWKSMGRNYPIYDGKLKNVWNHQPANWYSQKASKIFAAGFRSRKIRAASGCLSAARKASSGPPMTYETSHEKHRVWNTTLGFQNSTGDFPIKTPNSWAVYKRYINDGVFQFHGVTKGTQERQRICWESDDQLWRWNGVVTSGHTLMLCPNMSEIVPHSFMILHSNTLVNNGKSWFLFFRISE